MQISKTNYNLEKLFCTFIRYIEIYYLADNKNIVYKFTIIVTTILVLYIKNFVNKVNTYVKPIHIYFLLYQKLEYI